MSSVLLFQKNVVNSILTRPEILIGSVRKMMSGNLMERIQSLVGNASIEISPHTVNEFVDTIDLWGDVDPRLTARRTVMVNYLVPEISHFRAVSRATQILREHNHNPVPHLPASVIGTEDNARFILRELAKIGTQEVLVVGGNQINPNAEINAKDLGELAAEYFDRIIFPTFPEGHPLTNDDATTILDQKFLTVASSTNNQVKRGVITQWTSNSRVTSQWLPNFLSCHHDARVFIGVAGPCPRPNFEKFAQFCHVNIPPPKSTDIDVFLKPTQAVTALAADLEALGLEDHDRVHLHLFSLKTSRTLEFLHRLSNGIVEQKGTLLAA
mmetsp:Transcript_20845/g.27011  ORF Transcript_20845/g.27011 Transcript_20845/m.27011 type:complete len:326 (+) Transcript_20845:75-1052(+)